MKQAPTVIPDAAFRVVRFAEPLRADFWRALLRHVHQSEWFRADAQAWRPRRGAGIRENPESSCARLSLSIKNGVVAGHRMTKFAIRYPGGTLVVIWMALIVTDASLAAARPYRRTTEVAVGRHVRVVLPAPRSPPVCADCRTIKEKIKVDGRAAS